MKRNTNCIHANGNEFEFLIGKSIVKVEEATVLNDYGTPCPDGYRLICSDGTIIEIGTNEGCGGCSNGWSSFSDLLKLEQNQNVITNVEVKYHGYYEDEFTMFIYYVDKSISKLEGDDGYGNGYYGGGFYVTIKEVKENEDNSRS